MDEPRRLIEHVDEWLNGSIFPFPFSGKKAPKLEHIRKVAAIFLGDEAEGQLYLDFGRYDFSHIPIETLSVIYEQFLASEGKDKPSGAYYTPIPLVNFMLAELDDHRPFRPGMRALDPACGSGAFLVQCYRRLIERHRQANPNRPLRPTELRDLLVKHIHGVDHDLNACRVAALSLVLTMLDYLKPPDLESTPNFKLPDLHNQNIFHGDFFDREAPWNETGSYDWILGNPPWQAAKAKDLLALEWIRTNSKECPVVGNQVAEAFAWKVTRHLAPGGMISLLLPAMTFFKQGGSFRSKFFGAFDVSALANFSNLRRDLFDRRVEEPAAAIFYALPKSRPAHKDILVYSPLLANQEASRPAPDLRALKRKETWAIALNASEVRQISSGSVEKGDFLPLKVAMWGTQRDLRLITGVEKRLPRLEKVISPREIVIRSGLELRKEGAEGGIDAVPEIQDKLELVVRSLHDCGRIYSLPPAALRKIEAHRAYAREGRGESPLAVCRPPHIVLSGARTFAVYTEEFVVVPHGQTGIAGPDSQKNFLKALSLYLSLGLRPIL